MVYDNNDDLYVSTPVCRSPRQAPDPKYLTKTNIEILMWLFSPNV